MRASIPALYGLLICLTLTLTESSLSRLKTSSLIVLLVLGSITPLVELSRHISKIFTEQVLFQVPDINKVKGLIELEKKRFHRKSILIQYIGSIDAPFFTLFAKDGIYCRLPHDIQPEFRPLTLISYKISDNLSLKCFDLQIQDEMLSAHLVLKAKPIFNQDLADDHQTLFIQVINSQGERIAGSDVLVPKNFGLPPLEERIFVRHEIVLPPDLACGEYTLLVGAYYFKEGELIQLGSVPLDYPIIVGQRVYPPPADIQVYPVKN